MAPDEPARPEDEGPHAEAVDPAMADLLTRRHGRAKKAAGPEPERLEDIARYVDGELEGHKKAAVEARLAAEPELAEVVATLAQAEDAEREAAKVVPLVIPEGRRLRVGESSGGLRTLNLPERPKKSGMRLALTGIGAALALAAIMFLVTRPPKQTTGSMGAGNGKSESIAIGFEAGHALIEVEATQPGELAVLIATPAGTRAAGLCEAKTCLVTSDTLPLRSGKSTARAVLGEDGACAFVLALTAERADPHAAAKALGTVVSASCVLEPIAQLEGVAGARHVAFMKVP